MKLYQVDAFTDRPFKGNPAGVCILGKAMSTVWLQNIAAEMNLAETAFLLEEPGGYNLRWFTPETEVTLCGHATLATAHILWEQGICRENETIYFRTLSGQLSAKKTGDIIELDFPARHSGPAGADGALREAFSFEPSNVQHDGNIILMEFESDTIIRTIMPDFAKLQQSAFKGCIVTARSSVAEYDFISRFFAPQLGINEDPVTGMAHCYLAPYWAERMNKNSFTAFQASKRGGVVICELNNDRVMLRGKAVTVFEIGISPLCIY